MDKLYQIEADDDLLALDLVLFHKVLYVEKLPIIYLELILGLNIEDNPHNVVIAVKVLDFQVLCLLGLLQDSLDRVNALQVPRLQFLHQRVISLVEVQLLRLDPILV